MKEYEKFFRIADKKSLAQFPALLHRQHGKKE